MIKVNGYFSGYRSIIMRKLYKILDNFSISDQYKDSRLNKKHSKLAKKYKAYYYGNLNGK